MARAGRLLKDRPWGGSRPTTPGCSKPHPARPRTRSAWGIHSLSRQPATAPHHPPSSVFLIFNLNLPSSNLNAFCFVLSLHAVVISPSAALLSALRYWKAAARSPRSLPFAVRGLPARGAAPAGTEPEPPGRASGCRELRKHHRDPQRDRARQRCGARGNEGVGPRGVTVLPPPAE